MAGDAPSPGELLVMETSPHPPVRAAWLVASSPAGSRSLHGSSANIRRLQHPCTCELRPPEAGSGVVRRHTSLMRFDPTAKDLLATVFLASILASPAAARERIPGPPLDAGPAIAAGTWCPASGCNAPATPRFADAAAFGLAALAAARFVGRPARKRKFVSTSRDAI